MNLPILAAALAASMLCGAAVSASPPTGRAAFADPLDVPATASPLASARLLNAVARAGTRIVAVGQRGHILLSDDEGHSWTSAAVPVSVDLVAVQFPTPTHGWAVGHGGVVLATQDAGRNWTRQLDGRAVGQLLVNYYAQRSPSDIEGGDQALARLRNDARRFADEGPDKPLLDVWFDDEKIGYVVGSFNLLLRTEDGGQHWSPMLDRTDNPNALHLFAVRRVQGALYVTGEQGLVLRLDEQARRFRALPVHYKGTLFGVTGSPGAVLVHGLRGSVFRSADEGATWSKVETDMQAGLTGSALSRDGHLMLFGQAGQVLVSGNGGSTFARMPGDRTMPTSAGLVLDDDTLLLVGARGVRRMPQR